MLLSNDTPLFTIESFQIAYERNLEYYRQHPYPLRLLATIAKSQLPIERAAALTAIGEAITNDASEYPESDMREAYTRLRQRYHASSDHPVQAYGLKIAQRLGVLLNDFRDQYECPDCGGDLRDGVHQRQVDVDHYVCESEDYRADYFEDDGECPF